MTKKPFLNALTATAYILIITGLMNFVSSYFRQKEDTLLAPILVLSLFTLSAAAMGYIFCLTPIQLYFDNHKKEAVRLFGQTIGYFALNTVIILVLLFAGIFK